MKLSKLDRYVLTTMATGAQLSVEFYYHHEHSSQSFELGDKTLYYSWPRIVALALSGMLNREDVEHNDDGDIIGCAYSITERGRAALR